MQSTQKIETKPANNTYVYIWKTLAPHSVGHVAVQVGGQPAQEDGDYISIHPGLLPSVGPTAVLPMPAALSQTLHEDKIIEANYRQPAPDPDEPFTLTRAADLPDGLPPDYTLQFSDLNTQAMQSFMHQIRNGVPTAQTAYQLFPKINALGFFKDISHCLTYDPIDARHAPSRQPDPSGYGEHTYNCATLVTRILQKGGLPVTESATPWGQSPDSLAEQLLKMSR